MRKGCNYSEDSLGTQLPLVAVIFLEPYAKESMELGEFLNLRQLNPSPPKKMRLIVDNT